MKYNNVYKASFVSRPNRFIAEIRMVGEKIRCHVKNTGRCKELLMQNATVFVEKSQNPARKTTCSLISVKKGERIVNIDSQAPNKVFHEAILNKKIQLPGFEKITFIRPEKTFGNSRFDFYIEGEVKKAFIEVKGATLEEDGVAKFPDAPTERGVKHVLELVKAKEQGYEAFIIFIAQMNNIKYLVPNDKTHKEFGQALRFAAEKGVKILAYECDCTPDSIMVNGKKCRVVL